MQFTEQDIQNSLQVLQTGGVLLFPTDYGWCLGCDATNDAAVAQLRTLVQRQDGLIPVILAEERDVLQWVAAADLSVFDFVAAQEKPTAIVFEHALGFADNLPANDGTVLILLTQHPFCRHLVKRFRAPIASVPINPDKVGGSLMGIVHPYSTSVAPGIALDFPEAATSRLQMVCWNNGMPILQAYT